MVEMNSLAQITFEQAPVGLVLTEHRVILNCNETFARLFGYTKEALCGQSFRLLYSNDHEFTQIRDVGLARLSSANDYSDERIMRHANGSNFWCHFHAHTLTPQDPLARMVMSFASVDTPDNGPRLTPRERDVVMWLSRGKTSKEIALALGLSPRTIEDVRARLLKKFGAKNAAVLLARLSGLEQ